MPADKYIAPSQGVTAQFDGERTTVFVRDLILDAAIGAYETELDRKQRVRINIDLTIRQPLAPGGDRLDDVVCYDRVINGVKSILARGHINLVETLAEKIAAFCLDDRRVNSARVCVEKLDVVESAESVGVKIIRHNKH